MFDNLRADINQWFKWKSERTNIKKTFFESVKLFLGYPPMWAIVDYRFNHWANKYLFRIPVIGKFFYVPYRYIFKNLLNAFTGVDIAGSANISKGLVISHGLSLVVNGSAKIGRNCILYHEVTIGNMDGVPKIGDEVKIYPGSKIFGPITIGNNVTIGANSVVNKSFPSNVVIAGAPAKVLHKIKGK